MEKTDRLIGVIIDKIYISMQKQKKEGNRKLTIQETFNLICRMKLSSPKCPVLDAFHHGQSVNYFSAYLAGANQ